MNEKKKNLKNFENKKNNLNKINKIENKKKEKKNEYILDKKEKIKFNNLINEVSTN